MPPKVFITGASGYIGGDALFEIVKAHPDWEITCSIRGNATGSKIAAQYPFVRLVYADLDAVDVIEEEASNADIVYHFANCDHEPSARAIARGLARRNAISPRYWIHTSGALILGTETIDEQCYGHELSKVFDDWEGVNELTDLPDRAEHRNVDKIVLSAGTTSSNGTRTAIVCPPLIYGAGRGPDNRRSKQVYRATEAFIKHQRAFVVGEGKNIWHEVHVRDLSKLYLLLGEAAVSGGLPEMWNERGYYLAENGQFAWEKVLKAVADEIIKQGHGELKDFEHLSPEEAQNLLPYAKFIIGTNCRGRSIRARQLLGWNPRERSLLEEIPSIVESEVSRLELTKPEN